MSEPSDIPPPPDELHAFLARHQATGEPSADDVAAVRARVLANKPTAHTTTMLPRPARRFPLSQEWLAVAAVLVLLLGARALFVAFRSDEATALTSGPQVQAVVEAWRAGDVDGAQRLASQHCTESACASLSTSLAKAIGLSKRLDTLAPNELDELARLDAELSAGRASPLALEIARRKSAPPVPAGTGPGEELLAQAQAHVSAKRYEQAVNLLEDCGRVAPEFHPCLRVLGSTWAKIAARDADARAMEEARAAYERFLEVAPKDDEYVPRVRMVLKAVGAQHSARGQVVDGRQFLKEPAPEASTEAAQALFDAAQQAKANGDLAQGMTLALQVLAADPNHLGAKALLVEARSHAKELYLQGYILKDTDAAEARRLFQRVMELTPEDDEYHQKAKTRVLDMEGR